MDAGKRTINEIFNGSRILEIPFFQRAYVWGETQWERLLEDVENVSRTRTPYFMGYEIMKEIMAKESTENDQGVTSFQYNPASQRWLILFELSRPLDELEEMLLEEYEGRSMTMQEIYREHSVDKPYIKKNYKDILRKMEVVGKITAEPPANKRPLYKGEVTFSDKTKVFFSVRSD